MKSTEQHWVCMYTHIYSNVQRCVPTCKPIAFRRQFSSPNNSFSRPFASSFSGSSTNAARTSCSALGWIVLVVVGQRPQVPKLKSKAHNFICCLPKRVLLLHTLMLLSAKSRPVLWVGVVGRGGWGRREKCFNGSCLGASTTCPASSIAIAASKRQHQSTQTPLHILNPGLAGNDRYGCVSLVTLGAESGNQRPVARTQSSHVESTS